MIEGTDSLYPFPQKAPMIAPAYPPRPKKVPRLKRKKRLAVDTETTGVDLWHGCKPFFISICDEDGNAGYWEWDVDPFTREPKIPLADIRDIQAELEGRFLIFQNPKFDIHAFNTIGIDIPKLVGWKNIDDTLVRSHVLSSLENHGLKEQGIITLDLGDTDQLELREATNKARMEAKKITKKRTGLVPTNPLGLRSFMPIDVARANHPHFPAVNRAPKSGWWVLDTWLPRTIAQLEKYPSKHKWWTALSDYGCNDPARTIALYLMQEDALIEEGLKDQAETRRKLLEITFDMECRGVSVSPKAHKRLREKFVGLTTEKKNTCQRIAPVANINSGDQVQVALFQKLAITPTKENKPKKNKKTGQVTQMWSTEKEVLEDILEGLTKGSKEYTYVRNLLDFRKCGKMVTYLDGYEHGSIEQTITYKKANRLFRLPWWVLHPSFNITGTKTTRWSCTNPNAQNVAKKEDYNLRECFAPYPGRLWLSGDFSNIELRIFAYESGDQSLIDAFESGDSVHMVIARVLCPELIEAAGGEDEFKETDAYGWIKNGNFSLIYGAGQGKADRTYHIKGAYKTIRKRFKPIDRFMRSKHDEAVSKGYITTLGGYRLEVPTDGPHKAVNYFVQGSAGWFITEALIKVHRMLKEDYRDCYTIMQVHDELDFDIPKRPKTSQGLEVTPYHVAGSIQRIMEGAGKPYGFATPVSIKLIRDSWAHGEKITADQLAQAV
jgi:DNA polymerase I-like protein with 3'-5' exonuclease and polymerase domains